MTRTTTRTRTRTRRRFIVVSATARRAWRLRYGRVPSNLVTAKAFGVVLGWLLFQALLYVALPGDRVQGAPLPGSTKRLDYVLNGHAAFWCSMAMCPLSSMAARLA